MRPSGGVGTRCPATPKCWTPKRLYKLATFVLCSFFPHHLGHLSFPSLPFKTFHLMMLLRNLAALVAALALANVGSYAVPTETLGELQARGK